MIRFVDLTASYWPTDDGDPCCAFLDTVTDKFVEHDGTHVFDGPDEILEMGEFGLRCSRLVPDGFWKKAATRGAADPQPRSVRSGALRARDWSDE